MGRPTLTIVRGEAERTAPAGVRKFHAALAGMWAESRGAALRLDALAGREEDGSRRRAYVAVQAAFCRAHAARIGARLQQLKATLMPCAAEAPPVGGDRYAALRREARLAREFASRFEDLAEMAREHADLSTAWACDLSRTEELDRALILVELAQEVAHG